MAGICGRCGRTIPVIIDPDCPAPAPSREEVAVEGAGTGPPPHRNTLLFFTGYDCAITKRNDGSLLQEAGIDLAVGDALVYEKRGVLI